MKPRLPSRRRVFLWLLGIAFVVLAYVLWEPGSSTLARAPGFAYNGIWLSHGWLGDAPWFTRQGRDPGDFAPEKLTALGRRLTRLNVRDVFPHLCPADAQGRIPGWDATRATALKAALPGCRIIPWIGGSAEKTVDLADREWRRTFVASAGALLGQPWVDGIHLNIEPLPSGNLDFLALLEELRGVARGKVLSVAAYPPPTLFHPHPEVHWDLAYTRAVAERVDQFVPMLYDTALVNRKLYTHLLAGWTRELLATVEGRKILWGVPAYDDAGSGYHHPEVENICSAIPGIIAGINATGFTGIPGLAIYSEWTLDENEVADISRFVAKP